MPEPSWRQFAAPTAPADGEVAELVAWLCTISKHLRIDQLGDEADQTDRAAELLQHLSPPQPVPVSKRLPGAVEQALITAECALSDIAEGEAEENEGDPLEWAEKRAADALARIRPVMNARQLQTSEWPSLPAHALPLPTSEEASSGG